ncbi:MAG: TlpA family protein disulfide reductase [Candidatus Thiodiazotropha sp. (ex Gloverina cf. vestifex)]|nr:TlpA family protein disulfide reductase [Candidatus Thiodiazotropha sp. (ex Gloverina cf. vestifex)]
MRLLFFLLLLTCPPLLLSETFEITDSNGSEITVEVMPSEGDVVIIWLVDHDEHRAAFESLLQAVNKKGFEIWRVDLLDAYFLPRSSETIRNLPGDGVASLIDAAHRMSQKKILVAAYDRMPLPLLRGARQWQQMATESRLVGAMLFYPNLFGPPPIAGKPPEIDPILRATNIPLAIYQPALGSQRWRLDQIMQPLWEGGAPAYAYIVPGVRDWFFMGEGDHGPGEQAATTHLPEQILRFTAQLERHPKPHSVKPIVERAVSDAAIRTLVKLNPPKLVSDFSLRDIEMKPFSSSDLKHKVVLLNFWATWCPPCVEELPSLNRLQQRYKDREVRIVSIDFREQPEEMAKFLKDTPVDFPVLMDIDGRVSLDWQVFSFPSSFIINRRGQIRYTANRAIDWDSPEVWQVIDELLSER